MLRICLLNMPFATLNLPSLALTQLASVLRSEYQQRVAVDIIYANQEFVNHLGFDLYQFVVESLEANNTGLGEWLFRQQAFPELADNSEEYFRRFFPSTNEETTRLKQELLEKRANLDAFLDGLVDRHELDRADVVGFTSMFQQNVASFALARRLKDRCPDLITIAGGANCETPMGEEVIKHVQALDFVFSGPALVSFPAFIGNVLENNLDACHSIRGVYSRKNILDDPIAGGTIGEELGIDVPVHLDYDSFLDDLSVRFTDQHVPPRLNFETSRGCWWGERAHCTFCGLNGTTMAYRSMAPDLALQQFRSLFDRYSKRCNRFEAVDNILPRSYFQDVLPHLDTPPGVSLFYEVKADLPEAHVQILADARVTELQPGIESLASSTLKLMKKGTSVFTNLKLLKHCRTYGIFPLWNLLIGFPGEGEEVYEKYERDLPLLTHLSPPDGVNPVRFDRFSPYFTRAGEYGLDLHPYDYYEYIYPFSEQSLSNLAYYFMDRNIHAKYFTDMAKWIDRLSALVDRWRSFWGDDVSSHPRLSFKEDEDDVVVDSRDGELREHKIGPVALHLLKMMDTPRRATDKALQPENAPGIDVTEEFEKLRQLGLLFQEGDRYLSLVLPKAPESNRGRTLIYGLDVLEA